MTMDIPITDTEKWDELAEKVKSANGMWVVVGKYPTNRRGGRNSKATEALNRRGLAVEVRSRLGRATPERPWNGWWTFARTV